ncbi:unnamed protein product [Owenia fusiformis]|uniref:Apple domain-containing protein n=1 Tax=Owenia fusiformis TaxID=6347 RepID=A0A8S4NE46_OWEFU|nr:unnamed protein product [Owenia fusiformis]
MEIFSQMILQLVFILSRVAIIDSYKSAYFNLISKHSVILGHSLGSFVTRGQTECAQMCTRDTECLSFNLEQGTNTTRLCELNRDTKTTSSLVPRENWLYYEREKKVPKSFNVYAAWMSKTGRIFVVVENQEIFEYKDVNAIGQPPEAVTDITTKLGSSADIPIGNIDAKLTEGQIVEKIHMFQGDKLFMDDAKVTITSAHPDLRVTDIACALKRDADTKNFLKDNTMYNIVGEVIIADVTLANEGVDFRNLPKGITACTEANTNKNKFLFFVNNKFVLYNKQIKSIEKSGYLMAPLK